MADACIVCLGDLRLTLAEDHTANNDATISDDNEEGDIDAERRTSSGLKSIETDEESIALLLPCKHCLHNSCLKPWVERANSCPICRTIFNMVEISRTVNGPIVHSYAVQDKTQQAEVDPQMVIEDELFAVETFEPCLVCGVPDDGHGTMYCDGCDRACHIFCAGMDDAPDVWYCETCLLDIANDQNPRRGASSTPRRGQRRNGAPSQRRRRNNDAIWARVWQEVSHRLDLDLDFPFDEDAGDQRTDEQRREFERWQRRFEVANRQGTSNRLRGIAAASRLHQPLPARAPTPQPESQEELRAWNAFDKARESQDAPLSIRRRKRKATDSPASPREGEPSTTAQPILKRPRLRRPPTAPGQPESSSSAVRRNTEEPTFLSSLLREVETKPASATSPATSDHANGQFSPRNSSPARSPDSSECGTPPAATTPLQRPQSPPLSSTIMPMISPVAFSPFSPITLQHDSDSRLSRARRRRHRNNHVEEDEASPNRRAASTSPTRSLSYSAKEEVQRMVKLALGTRYRDKSITKDQYTDINRDVSRKMYELVHDASALTGQGERERWQSVANEEVRKAVAALPDQPTSPSEQQSE